MKHFELKGTHKTHVATFKSAQVVFVYLNDLIFGRLLG